MKTITTIIFLFFIGMLQSQTKESNIQFNKNVEFFGYLLELGDPSDNDPDHPLSQIINSAPQDKTNPLLIEIFSIGANMDYSTLIHLIYLLPEFPFEPTYKLPENLMTFLGFKQLEEQNKLWGMVQKVNQFYLESSFDTLWKQMAPYQLAVLKELDAKKPSAALFLEMEEFYQFQFESYEIIPSLTLFSGPGFGIKNPNESKAIFILGPLDKNYDFTNERFYPLTIHEFGHSFVNSVVLQFNKEIALSSSLFDELESSMRPQGYSNWETCVIEHFVRAGEVIISRNQNEEEMSSQLLKDYTESRDFQYLPFIVNKLSQYRQEDHEDYREAVKKTLLDLHQVYVLQNKSSMKH